MRIGVIGAGAIGGVIAATLDRAGATVAVAARGANLDAIRREGLQLSGAWGDHRAEVEADTVLHGSFDLVVVATKAADAGDAIGANSRAVSRIPLVVIQNGLDAVDTAERAAPDAEVVGGLSLMAASHLEPGRVVVTAGLPTVLGRRSGEDLAPASAAAAVLGDAIPVSVAADLTGASWTKLLINHVNALPAITGLSVQEVVADRTLLLVLTASMREAVRVAEGAGVRFAALGGLSPAAIRLVGHAPLVLGTALPRAMARRMGAVPNPGSTLQSIRRGSRTEIDALNGAVVRTARESGEDAPIDAALTALVHEVERTGRFLTRDEVIARVPWNG